MKPDDDELAEAALLLAHLDPDSAPMPDALKKKILREAAGVSSELRHSTTKAGAISIENVPPSPPSTRSFLRSWGGWIAAAACFAIVVYQWRVRNIEGQASGRAVAAAPSALVETRTIALRRGAGALGELSWSESTHTGTLTLTLAPASETGEQYQLWISDSDAGRAVSAGSFRCDPSCAQQSFASALPAEAGSVRRVWVTRAKSGESASPRDPSRVVAEGSIDGHP